MTFLQLVFYGFSAVAIFSGIAVVASKNPVHGALSLVLTFVAMSGVWILLHAEFLALILVLVYVGAVMTLFLFVVMMLNIDKISFREGFVRYLPVALIFVLLIIGIIMTVIGPARFGLVSMPAPLPPSSDYSNTADLGMVLYTQYAYPFELAAILLLTAIVAAISLTHHKVKKHKTQNIARQIAVQKKDRLRLISMPSEKRPNQQEPEA